MKRALLVLCVALVAVPPAAAKELRSVSVCGASECATFDDEKTATMLAHMGESSGRAAAPGPYYVVTFKGDAEGEQFSWKAFYVPEVGLWAGFDDMYGLVRWSTMTESSAAVLERATDGLEPFAAPHVESARVDGVPVSGDASGYLGLFDAEPAGAAVEPSTYDWVAVDLVSSAATPWTMSDRDLMFSPSAGAIERMGTRIRLDDEVAAAVAAREALPGEDGVAWLTLALAFGGVAAAILLALAAQRLGRPVPRPETA